MRTKQVASAKKQPEHCKGEIYRAYVSSYNLGFNVRVKKMKQMSCKGCQFCGWLDDCLEDTYGCGYWVEGIQDLENKKLYKITYVDDSTTGYDGCDPDYHLEFKEVV